MREARIILATIAATAVLALGVVVAFASPNAVRQAASPSAGAAKAVYCAPGEKRRRLNALRRARRQLAAFNRRARKTRRVYFRTHGKARQRVRFVKRQKVKRRTLQKRVTRLNRQYRRCD